MQATELIRKLQAQIKRHGDGPIITDGLRSNEVNTSTDEAGNPSYSFVSEPEGPQALPTRPLRAFELAHMLHLIGNGDLIVFDEDQRPITDVYLSGYNEHGGEGIMLVHHDSPDTKVENLGAETTPDTAAEKRSTCSCHAPQHDQDAKPTATMPTIAHDLYRQVQELVASLDKARDVAGDVLKICLADIRLNG